MDMQKVSLTTAFNNYFGRLPDQNMSAFSQEIKAATASEKDRADWIEMFKTVGYEVVS